MSSKMLTAESEFFGAGPYLSAHASKIGVLANVDVDLQDWNAQNNRLSSIDSQNSNFSIAFRLTIELQWIGLGRWGVRG